MGQEPMPNIPWYFEHALLLSLPVAAVVVLVGRWLIVWWGSRRAREQARDRLRALGGVRVELSPSDEDHVVTLRGTLRVVGAPCTRYEDGKAAAAATLEISDARTWFEAPEIETSSHRRADELHLMVGDRQVVVDGELSVWVGSRELWPGVSIRLSDDALATQVLEDGGFDPRQCDGFPVFRSLADGDEVLAQGTVARNRDDRGHAAGYREQAMRWRLHAGGELGIPVAAVKGPRFAARHNILTAGPALVLAAALIGWVGWSVDVDHDDALTVCKKPCSERGACWPLAQWRGIGVSIDCVEGDAPACERMADCTQRGLCSLVDGRCAAASPEDCAPIEACRLDGKCTPRDGRCQVGSDRDCRESVACGEQGWCTAHLDLRPPTCGFGSDADCEKTNDCHLRGLCSHRAGRCVTAKRADCLQARYCQDDGLCSFDAERGLCHAKSDSDCEGSRACERDGRCFAVDDVCRPRPGQREPF